MADVATSAPGISKTLPPDLAHSEFVHISQEHDSNLCSKLYKQWQDLQHCDLTLAVKDGELRAHSCIIAAFSPKLKSVLENSAQTSGPNGGVYIQLLFDVAVLRCLLNMMYTGVLSFNTSMLSSVLSAARWLQMEEVVCLCQDYKVVTGGQGDKSTLTDDIVLCEIDSTDPHLLLVGAGDGIPMGDNEAEDSSLPKGGRRNRIKTARKRGRPSKVASQSKALSRAKSRAAQSKPTEVLLEASQIKQEKDDVNDILLLSGADILQDYSLEDVKEKDADTPVVHLETGSTESSNAKKLPSARPSLRRRGPKKTVKDSASKNHPTAAKKHSPNSAADASIKVEKLLPEKDDSAEGGLMSHSEWVEMQEVQSSDNDEVDFALGKTDSISCKKCMAKFTKLEEYRNHVLNHPTFTCDMCPMTYFRKSNLTRHMRTSHFTQHHLTCKKCGIVAKTESGLRTHWKEVHNETKPFMCEHPGCSYTTYKFDFLHRHAEIHSEVKRYICDKCGQGFSQHAGLMSHHRACYQLQQFLCDICGQSFNHVQSMRAHRRTIHFGEKPYLCKVCSNPFSDQRNLKRHMRIHENAFPYQCEICKQKYRHSNSLKAHMKKHGDVEFHLHTLRGGQLTQPDLVQCPNQVVTGSFGGGTAMASMQDQQHISMFAQTDTHAGVVLLNS